MWKLFLEQFDDLLIKILLAAAIISFVSWLVEREGERRRRQREGGRRRKGEGRRWGVEDGREREHSSKPLFYSEVTAIPVYSSNN